MNKIKSLNKNQKIILTIWVILIVLIFLATLTPIQSFGDYGVEKSWVEPNLAEFATGSIMISIPLFVIYKIWGS